MKLTKIFLGIFCLVGTHTLGADSNQEKIEVMVKEIELKFPVPNIDPKLVLSSKDKKNIVFVDVREKYEQSVSTIKNAIPYSEFEKAPDVYRGKKIIAFCTIGYRSSITVQKLVKSGFDAWNLRGSLLKWVHAGGEIVNPKGVKTNKVHVYGKKWDLLPKGYQGVYGEISSSSK